MPTQSGLGHLPSLVAPHHPTQTIASHTALSLSTSNKLTSITTTGSKRQLCTSSPASSPQRSGSTASKRRRTLTVSATKHTPTLQRLTSTIPSIHHRNIHPQKSLHLEDFKESRSESSQQKLLQSKVFAYLAQKHALGRSSQYCDNNIKQLKQFLALSTAGSSPNQYNFYYMDLLDENPDFDETMLLVAEKLLNELQSDYQDGNIVLVGDGKTYEHLMNIKRLYDSGLQKLLIFLGDWHTLLNH